MALFEELDFRATPMGSLSLRRRRLIGLDTEVIEVKLGDEFLMSSLFTVGERALATLALAAVEGEALHVAVGGLGLGYTACEALKDPRVGSLVVIEALEAVIDWHLEGLVPLGPELTGDERCRFVRADFFGAVRKREPLDPRHPGRRFDAILLDIDHSPLHLLNPTHADFYGPEGLGALAGQLTEGGVFAMWSDDAPDAGFQSALGAVFRSVEAKVVAFENPFEGRTTCTIYVASDPGDADG